MMYWYFVTKTVTFVSKPHARLKSAGIVTLSVWQYIPCGIFHEAVDHASGILCSKKKDYPATQSSKYTAMHV